MPTSIDTSTGWLNFERRNWIALVVVALLAGFAVGNGRTTTSAVAHISYQLGDTKHKVACEHRRANKAVAIATQAIRSATTEAIPVPSPAAIPADTCDHPATK